MSAAVPGAAAPFADLIETSLQEAVFLWERWERELTSPTRNLSQVWSWTEDRLQGALDGVRIAGDNLPAVVAPAFEGDEPHAIACAAALLGSSPSPAAQSALSAALSKAQ